MVWPDDAHRATGAQRDLAGDVASLRALGKDRAPHHIVNRARFDARRVQSREQG